MRRSDTARLRARVAVRGLPARRCRSDDPEMMHVWVVDNPGGPFAENLDDDWVRTLLAESTVQAEE